MRQHEGEGGSLYVYPALFALTLAVFDLVFLCASFTETLPASKRVGDYFILIVNQYEYKLGIGTKKLI